MKTGLEDIETVKLFGLLYIIVGAPRPYDTTILSKSGIQRLIRYILKKLM